MPNGSQIIARIFEYYEQEINYDQLKCDFFKLVSLGNVDKLKSFLQKNESLVAHFINHQDINGYTALCLSCYKNHFEISQILLQYQADTNIANNHQRTPLYYCQTPEMLLALIKTNPKPNLDKNGDSAVHFMIKRHYPPEVILTLFLQNNPDISLASTEDGQNIIALAISCKNIEFLELLLRKNYLSDLDRYEEKKYLHLVMKEKFCLPSLQDNEGILPQNTSKIKIALLEIFLSQGCMINETDKNQQTPLHYALEQLDQETAIYLIDKTADLYLTDKYDVSCFKLILKHDLVDVFKFLLDKNHLTIDKIYSDNKTLLHLATENKSFNIVNLLLSRKIDINAQDNQGKTALHYAVINEELKIIEILLLNDADRKIKDQNDKTPIEYNIHKKHSIGSVFSTITSAALSCSPFFCRPIFRVPSFLKRN